LISDSTKSRAERLAALSKAERSSLLSDLTLQEIDALNFDWQFWGRPEQFAPAVAQNGLPWNTWLILAGRGFGKTRTGAEFIRDMLCGSTPLARGRWKHVALIAETAADARDVMVGQGKAVGESSGLLQVHRSAWLPKYTVSKRRLEWPNGAIASVFNATEPDQLRGPQFDGAWCDELAKWRYARETWDNLQFGMRTGTHPQVVVTTTPRPILLLKELIADKTTAITRGSTKRNLANLAPAFIKAVYKKYEGTRLGRQELDAEVLEDVEGSLWKRAQIEKTRAKLNEIPDLIRIVVSIDPAVSTNDGSNETGIIVAGLSENGHAWILDDNSDVYSPTEWATEAVALYHNRRADRIIGERNNGGDMIESTLRAMDENVSYRSVWASKGKFIRAEPVSALYEQGRVHHVGAFTKLEDQMCAFTADFDRDQMGYSPDRLDALVWALTELLVAPETATLAFTSA
jgi:phage terminase large subunit-like protein